MDSESVQSCEIKENNDNIMDKNIKENNDNLMDKDINEDSISQHSNSKLALGKDDNEQCLSKETEDIQDHSTELYDKHDTLPMSGEESGSNAGSSICESSFISKPRPQRVSESAKPGRSIKEALHSQRKISLDPRLMYGRGIGRVLYEEAPSRKSSLESFMYPYVPRSRKSSLDPFFSAPYPHHKISVTSNSLYGSSGYLDYTEDTCETLPHADHYSDVLSIIPDIRQRATLDELREDDVSQPRTPCTVVEGLFDEELKDVEEEESSPVKDTTAVKFGWIQGVLVRCLLNIFGVMLFLRLTWITGQAGTLLSSVIILLSMVVTIITSTSMSAICTNGEVKGGGAYYMISRSLGPEFGGSIGIVFSLANAIAAAMYIVGFAETVRDIMWENDAVITGDSLHEVRIIGGITAVLLVGIVVVGMEWEAKAQLGLLAILVTAVITFIVGTFIPPSDEKISKGVVGYKGTVFMENIGPDFRQGESFFSVFAIFFPAATGILAGANISGDLKDAQKAIPKGTLLAIVITGFVYLLLVWTAGSCIIRDAIGPVAATQLAYQSNTSIGHVLSNISIVSDCSLVNGTCEYGLLNDKGAVGIASAFRPIILAGIFSATLSSALASMIGAPKVFQALAKDKLFPYIHVFAEGQGKSNEPVRGYILTFAICVAVTCIGDLDVIAPIISNFFLMSYTLINYSCFNASVANTPGFRPGFRYYNKWVSLIGSLLCFAIMFLINWWASLVTFVIVGGLYMYVHTTKPAVNWGSSTQARAYSSALTSTLHLLKVDEHVKNFRPQILVMSGFPRNRPALTDFVSAITKKQSLLVCGHIFMGDMSDHVQKLRSTAAYKWFEKRKIRAFYNSVVAPNLRIGAQVLMQALGVGKLRPNTLMLGYKTGWQNADPIEMEEYVNIIEDGLDLKYGVGILRVKDGFDIMRVPDDSYTLEFSDSEEEEESSEDEEENKNDKKKRTDVSTINENASNGKSFTKQRKINSNRLMSVPEGFENLGFETENLNSTSAVKPSRPVLTSSVSKDSVKTFRNKLQGTIDVWWLYDDGGLTLLIPYILSKRRLWKNCKLRVFCAASKKGQHEEDEARMTSLLKKFRIDFVKLTIVKDLTKKPTLAMYKKFEAMIRKWRLKTGEYSSEYPWKINDGDLISNKLKTYRYIRLRDQLLTHSQEASLVVITLPIPKKASCPGALYMSWLETLTEGLPPTLLLRGNQQSVLTYYS
ncbi:solute carrier family 12 (sodium/potassium/chloride transporter), member 2 [Mytilus galloprovincialis]|uniref:Solute carrier family 12 (Sodium/potassium/chloride transporter), member 2 n=1 Tax=Mytilus galloprovincialis TaxID=29158 RepID=A0A8B6FCK3_MYTGA|nr:solute carrier family 12 (sodium/potassium/chloride transporter), member 2 [Mytilus galloprovincialis]